MCYGPEAQPPGHGRGGAARSEEDLVLESADGTRFSARLARAAAPNGAGVVILPDVRGLFSFYCALARLFAEAGIEAIAIDYFGRTAGLTEGRPDDFDFMSHVHQTRPETVSADAAAAIEHLRGLGTVEKVFTLGFCFGGAMSWRQSADQPGLAGAVGFYGRPEMARDRLPGMQAPLLLLAAGDDKATSREEFAKWDAELSAAGVPHRAVVYEGAPHSFFDRASAQWGDACADSWKQILGFIEAPAAA